MQDYHLEDILSYASTFVGMRFDGEPGIYRIVATPKENSRQQGLPLIRPIIVPSLFVRYVFHVFQPKILIRKPVSIEELIAHIEKELS